MLSVRHSKGDGIPACGHLLPKEDIVCNNTACLRNGSTAHRFFVVVVLSVGQGSLGNGSNGGGDFLGLGFIIFSLQIGRVIIHEEMPNLTSSVNKKDLLP